MYGSLGAAALLSLVALLLPHVVIRPFVAQDPTQLMLALWVVRWAPIATAVLSGLALALAVRAFRSGQSMSRGRKVATVIGVAVVVSCAVLCRVNIYEKMFHSIGAPRFVRASEAKLDARDMVLAVRSGAVSRAYPVRALTFHHIVNDVLDGSPIAVTYCSLCHTGLVFSREVGGRALTFFIGGINNQNMLMRDRETGSFWQQSTGVAIAGPLAGTALRIARSDELGFELWKAEAPGGEVLAPVAADEQDYASADWETRMAKRPPVKAVDARLGARDLVIGVSRGAADEAFPLSFVEENKVTMDTLDGAPIVLLVGPDGQSVRAFEARTPADDHVELFAKQGAAGVFVDGKGVEWGFDGCAARADGRRCMPMIPSMRSYWFDWQEHHPATIVARRPGVR